MMTFSIDAFIRQAYWRSEYNRYMHSGTWAAIRDVKLACASHSCEECGVRKSLDVHHLTYDRFGGDERMTDLKVLCRSCHEAAHGRTFEEA